jgi:hypothetical protein
MTHSRSLAAHFSALKRQWEDETEEDSSIQDIIKHPAYQKIIRLGPKVIPLILAELQQKPDHWFHALRELSQGANPIPEQCGNLEEMALAWIKWGRLHGHIK